MLDLITDRSQAHVNLLKRLRKKTWASMTASEQALWYGDAAKGAYNYTDLNRVESAVATLSGALGLGLETKTDWTQWDTPSQADMERYLGNVVTLRETITDTTLPALPNTMAGLTYEGANAIEKVLEEVYRQKVSENVLLLVDSENVLLKTSDGYYLAAIGL